MEQAFNPLGAYLNFWHDKIAVGEQRYYTVALINDEDRPRAGELRLSFIDAQGNEVGAEEMPFEMAPLGAQSYNVMLRSPAMPGQYSLRASATASDDPGHPTISQRSVSLQKSEGRGETK